MAFIDYFKLIAENNLISKNKWLIMLIITSLSGGATAVVQTFNVAETKAAGIKAVREVATAFQSQAIKPEKEITIQRVQPCGSCKELWITHERTFHQ